MPYKQSKDVKYGLSITEDIMDCISSMDLERRYKSETERIEEAK